MGIFWSICAPVFVLATVGVGAAVLITLNDR